MTKRKRKPPAITTKMHVPSLPVLAHLLYRIDTDYKCLFTKEVAEFTKQYTPYVAEALKPGTPEAAWHKRARDIAYRGVKSSA